MVNTLNLQQEWNDLVNYAWALDGSSANKNDHFEDYVTT